MAIRSKLRIALAGLQFGSAFVPIYLHHPDVEYLGIVDPNRSTLDDVGDKFDVLRRHTDLNEVVRSADYDAVHLVTPLAFHVEQTLAVLKSGKHCACTVPMAFSLKDIRAIIAARRRSGRNYMMMETAVYTRHFFYLRGLAAAGRLGRIQFLRGAHYQDLENWPSYWRGLPPMHYATHAVAPGMAVADTHATAAHCFGSGVMRRELQEQYGNPYPIETAIFEMAGGSLAMEVTRSLFHTARGYTESFCVYGEKMTVEWPQIEEEDELVVFSMQPVEPGRRGSPVPFVRVSPPDRQDLLPPSIARFTMRGKYDDTNPQKSFEAGGGHKGSHPHLVHEFVRSIVEERRPWVDERRAASWTAAGISAHQSAMKGGARVRVPSFD